MSQSQPTRSAEDLVDRLVAEYADRLARGDDPCREELLAEAPQFRAELEQCFRLIDGAEGERPKALGVGMQIGDYRLGRVLGRGGMSVVYEAEQISLQRKVALKVLRQHVTLDGKQVERFLREARAAARLSHEHVVRVHAVGAAAGHSFLAFELVEGPTLARVIQILAAAGKRPTAKDLAVASGASFDSSQTYANACAQLLQGVFAAVSHAHKQGVIHRDLKPSNILLTESGKPLVADFGLAKDASEVSLSITGETLGTPHYMAPEQARSLSDRVDARTDVYALGVMLYELLTLQRPFRGDNWPALMHQIVMEDPRSPHAIADDIPTAIADVCLKAMSKSPQNRYATVDEFRLDVERAVRGDRVQAEATSGPDALVASLLRAMEDGRPYEYRSKLAIAGLPLLHIVVNSRNPKTGNMRWARGVFAFGSRAVGLVAGGVVAVGPLAVGAVAIGLIAIGVLAFGYGSAGLAAIGYVAQGLIAIGDGGQGVIGEWLLHPDVRAPGVISEPMNFDSRQRVFQTSVVVALLNILLVYPQFRASWPAAEAQRFLWWMARVWMPLLLLLPVAVAMLGTILPYPVLLLWIGVVSFGGRWTARMRFGHPVSRHRTGA